MQLLVFLRMGPWPFSFDVYGFFIAGEVGTAAASVAEPASAGLNRILWGAGEKEG